MGRRQEAFKEDLGKLIGIVVGGSLNSLNKLTTALFDGAIVVRKSTGDGEEEQT